MALAINGKLYESQLDYEIDKLPKDGVIPTPPVLVPEGEPAQPTQKETKELKSEAPIAAGWPLQAPEKATDALKDYAATLPPAEAPKPKRGVWNTLTGNDGGERYQLWPERMVKDLWEAAKAPGDAMQGKLPMWAMDPDTGVIKTSPDVIEKMFNLAGAAVLGPAPIAKKMVDGTLGSFAGVRSKTVPKDKIYAANNMELDGLHPDEIYAQTGMFRGADKRWRYEIADKDAKLVDSAFDKTVEASSDTGTGGWSTIEGGKEAGEVTVSIKGLRDLREGKDIEDFFDWVGKKGKYSPPTLDKVIDHPELFKAYPHLKEIKVEALPKEVQEQGIKGMYAEDMNTVFLADNLNPDYAKSIILHEVQHGIQKYEGFARGGSEKQFIPEKLPEAEKHFETIRSQSEHEIKTKHGIEEKDINSLKTLIKLKFDGEDIPPRHAQILEEWKVKAPEDYKRLENIAKAEELLRKASNQSMEKYRRLMGEVEARNVQHRMDFDEFQRAQNPPRMTEDRPRFVQEYRSQVGTSDVQLNSGGAGIQYNILSDFWNKVTSDDKTKVTETKSDPLTKFPSQEEGLNAIKQGFGYGTGNEPYINAEQANIKTDGLIRDIGKMISSPSRKVDLTKFENIDQLAEITTMYAQAALAVNRSAIATAGFDPDRIGVSTKLGRLSVAGAYDPDSDRIWMNRIKDEPPSTIVHESIHRGLQMLREKSPEARELIKKLPNEEFVVRYMMAKKMGNPEEGRGETADDQRKIALEMFNADPKFGKIVDQIEEIAANLRAKQRERGPR